MLQCLRPCPALPRAAPGIGSPLPTVSICPSGCSRPGLCCPAGKFQPPPPVQPAGAVGGEKESFMCSTARLSPGDCPGCLPPAPLPPAPTTSQGPGAPPLCWPPSYQRGEGRAPEGCCGETLSYCARPGFLLWGQNCLSKPLNVPKARSTRLSSGCSQLPGAPGKPQLLA